MSASSERWKADAESTITAAERARAYVRAMSQTEFVDDTKTQDAVVMNLIVLAEAAKGMPAEMKARWPAVPWQEIDGFRHRAAHSAMTLDLSLDLSIVWQIATRDLPDLIPHLRALLAGAQG